jgi:branched-chain amino acid transport system ATP-binding protein
MTAALAVENLSVRFGGHLAVSSVDLEVAAGRVTGLIGPNGAGKTTTFNAICGVITPTAGRVRLGGRDISGLSTHQRARLGVGRTFQRLEVFSSLSVRDNVQVGLEIRRSWSRRRGPSPQYLSGGTELPPVAEVDLILDRLGLQDVSELPVGSLPTGQARLVELGRALAARPSVLLLDEPASGLDEHETIEFGRLLEDLAAAGLGILLVEHDIALVMRVCQELSVLDFGQIIAQGPPAEIRANEAVLAAYLGGSLEEEAVELHLAETTNGSSPPGAPS